MRNSAFEYVMRETSPCEGCGHFEKCRAELMACRSFAYYVRVGRFHPETPRDPSYAVYKRIFSEDDSELINLIREMNKEARDNDGQE